jgi:hypothetical protein
MHWALRSRFNISHRSGHCADKRITQRGSSATSNAQYTELGSEREYTEKWGYEKLMAALRERLSEAEIEKLAAEGAAWSEDQAVEEGLKI